MIHTLKEIINVEGKDYQVFLFDGAISMSNVWMVRQSDGVVFRILEVTKIIEKNQSIVGLLPEEDGQLPTYPKVGEVFECTFKEYEEIPVKGLDIVIKDESKIDYDLVKDNPHIGTSEEYKETLKEHIEKIKPILGQSNSIGFNREIKLPTHKKMKEQYLGTPNEDLLKSLIGECNEHLKRRTDISFEITENEQVNDDTIEGVIFIYEIRTGSKVVSHHHRISGRTRQQYNNSKEIVYRHLLLDIIKSGIIKNTDFYKRDRSDHLINKTLDLIKFERPFTTDEAFNKEDL